MESDLANYTVTKAQGGSTTGKMLQVISNFQIESAIKNLNDNDVHENVADVFPANHMNRFIDYKFLISEEKGKYPFLIANTDSAEKTLHIGGAYWTLNQKQIFFFDSLRTECLKNFIIQDVKNIIKKILNGVEKMIRTDKKLTLVNIRFSMDADKNLNKNELDSLSDTARNFFRFVQSFGNKLYM